MDTPEERADAILAELHANARPRLIVISGPSGVGKDTIIDRMRELRPEIHFAVTATTRPRRPNEIDGIHYYFYSAEEFAEKRAADEFLETAVVYGNEYGVPRTPIRNALARGQDVIVKVDTQGAGTIRRLVPAGIFIFIAPPTIDQLAQQLWGRKTDDPDTLLRRFRTAQEELGAIDLFDYVVFNEFGQPESAVDRILGILQAEQQRLRQPDVHV
ncbi:MAG: Guanylate kinase [uncultured Thermomicrobiales bacterium]|uniref:Guanylate kinase n=1 Tax=uncultured Thermomicrobiales bacterium TaxID=1645740 RepID=A0A6J4VIB4_9BACT|nr:MAG: Guanylate kinase [uncultured Thermomicrobiales bacterium]